MAGSAATFAWFNMLRTEALCASHQVIRVLSADHRQFWCQPASTVHTLLSGFIVKVPPERFGICRPLRDIRQGPSNRLF
jgi:hypothetical protein